MAWQRSFRPLTGMVPKSFEEHGLVIGFSPPYGDGTESGKLTAYKKMFSPPYGDSTDITANNILFCKFSPPYGDSTDDIKYREAREKFSPPYEDGTLNISQNIVKWKN